MITPFNVKDKKENMYGVVFYYCLYGPDDADTLYHFVKMGASLEILDHFSPNCSSPLHVCARHGKLKQLRALLDMGTPPTMIDGTQETPLCRAFTYRQQKCARMLIEAGADMGFCAQANIPPWAKEFVRVRKMTRTNAITILGLLRCGCGGSGALKNNGRDVLRIIARCVWSMRGHSQN